MGEVDKVQERIKANLEAMKEQMATMMEVMMSMKKIMEVNAAAIAATSAISDMVGQRGKELGSTGGPYFVQVQNKHSFPPYGLAPNYVPTNVVRTPDENVNNSTPILIENQQPRSDHAYVPQLMGETHEIPHHNLVNFEPSLGYAIEGQAVGGVALNSSHNHNPCILLWEESLLL